MRYGPSCVHCGPLHKPKNQPLDGYRSINALAEAVNAAYKTDLINRGRPWRCIDDVELSTAQWVAWYNQERLHEALGYVSPSEYEAALTGTSQPASQPTPALATEEQNLGYFTPARGLPSAFEALTGRSL
ncbi:integrase core domain-containing protein [Mycobacterium sp. MUNTM1]